jgi:hypothetical protein
MSFIHIPKDQGKEKDEKGVLRTIGKPFEIPEFPKSIGRRASIHWKEKKGERVAEKVELIYMVAGENLPTMIATDGSSVRLISDDDSPCGLK